MKTLTAVALLALALAVPAGASTTGGLKGLVQRGPVTPVCQAGVPCDAPAKHVTITFVRNGVSRSVTTGDDGRYVIRLAPGTWTVKLATGRMGSYGPKAALVRAGVVRVLNLSIDTGIR